MALRVIVFSTIRLFSEALASALLTREDIAEVCACHLAEPLADTVVDFRPDIVLLDITTEQTLAEARVISDVRPGTPILALAMPEIPEHVIACADAGFTSYIPRHATLDELGEVIRMALRGECVCHPRVAASLLHEIRARRRQSITPVLSEPLTHRECEVLCLLSHGLCNKEIARQLTLSVATVKNHLHSVFIKLGVNGRTEALVRVRNEPWLTRSA